ncbi:MAG: Rpn family recombination-promoting nuclease/putative transposase [Lachnospiraceae bacterium]|nr:Rpn family recombination-promoting nuclease/putative transposase [Lachnospiraceae bacterium]
MAKNYRNTMEYSDKWKKKTGKLDFKMCNDYLFRVLLQADEDTLRLVISAFLGVDRDSISDVEILNPIILGENIADKEIHLDVHTMVNHTQEMNFEMQLLHHKGWVERSLLYMCRAFDNINHGDSYLDLKGVWQISFCNFTLFGDAPEFFSTYMFLNIKDGSVYSDRLKISNVNLTRIDLATDNDKKNGLVNLARLFKAETWEDLKMIATENKQIDHAISSAWQLTEDESIRYQMRKRAEEEWLWKDLEQGAIYAREELRQAKEDLDQVKGELDQTKGELDQAKGELDQTKGELDQTKGELDQTKAALMERERESAESKAYIAELQRQIEMLKQH